MIPEKVAYLLAEILGQDEEDITEQTAFTEEYGIEPIDVAKLVIAVEKKFDIAIQNEDSGSISLIINSEYGITTIIPCSRALSEIIIKKGGYFDEILLYRLLKIKNSSGNYYIRLSQNIDISYEEIEQENNNLKNLEGNVRTFVKITQEMLDNQKKNVEKINWENIIVK